MNKPLLSTPSDRELSAKARAGYVALLLAGLTMAAVTASLWLTEPTLPRRTSITFAVMTVMGLCWAGFAAWVLASRRALNPFHDVVAARMSLSFCCAALAGALSLAIGEGNAAAGVAAAIFAVMLGVAAVLLARARRRLRELSARRAELEQTLGNKPR